MALWHAWFDLKNGAVLTNLVASAICLVSGYLVALRHFRCVYCRRRPGRVPVKGTVHHACRRCALERGHSH